MSPLVSFCIPVHNSERFLEETVISLLAQDYPTIEILCVDDYSTDNSLKILKKFPEVISISNYGIRGAAAARNRAFEYSKGDYIVFIDSDDLLDPHYCSTQLQLLLNRKDCVAISNWGRFYNNLSNYNEDIQIIKEDLSFYQWVVKYWTNCSHTTPPGRVMIPRNILLEAGLWDETLSLNDDFEFFTRIFNHSNTIIYNDKARLFYRSGVGGLSSKTRGLPYQLSNFNSLDKATSLAGQRFIEDKKIQRACANMWMNFAYSNYPNHTALVNESLNKVKMLGGTDLPFPSGGITKMLSEIIGWKSTKLIKNTISR